MDETRVQVLNEPGKSAQSQSYMWVQKGGPSDKLGVLFNYKPSRSTATADSLLQNYQGALMSDGYAPYRIVAATRGLTHLCCWAHARRKFMEAKKAQPKGKTGKADMAITQVAKLYAIERQEKDSDAAARHRVRQDIKSADPHGCPCSHSSADCTNSQIVTISLWAAKIAA